MTGGSRPEGGTGLREEPALELRLAAERGRVEEALVRAVEALEDELPERLAKPIRHAVLSGGKRLRPILCAAAYRACRARTDGREAAASDGADGAGNRGDPAVYDLAAAVELIHAYSLMHDDLPCMDDADLRRGEPTSHRLFGEEDTMVAGAALIPGAALQAWRAARALGCDESRAGEVVRVLAAAAGGGGMVGGQLLDLLGEGRTLEAGELDDLHRRKTGALLAASLRMGAVAARADEVALRALESYGWAVGLAFQIADDILDATASAEELGKHPSDLDREKSTYVGLHGLDGARERARAEVARARTALEEAALDAPLLSELAAYVVDRRR